MDRCCIERGDAFLVALLPHLIAHSSDESHTQVYMDLPISERLFYLLTEIFRSSLAKYTDIYHLIEIHATTTSERLGNAGAVIWGIYSAHW